MQEKLHKIRNIYYLTKYNIINEIFMHFLTTKTADNIIIPVAQNPVELPR